MLGLKSSSVKVSSSVTFVADRRGQETGEARPATPNPTTDNSRALHDDTERILPSGLAAFGNPVIILPNYSGI
jgi:hypothetical protein